MQALALVLCLMMSASGCAMWASQPRAVSTIEYNEAEQLRERNATKFGAVGIGCAAGVATGVALITTPAGIPILVGTGLACGAAAVGYSQEVPQTYYGTVVYDPYSQPRQVAYRPPAFIYSSDTALRDELSKELGRRGWRIIEANGRPSGALFFSAKRLGAGVQVEVYGEGGAGMIAFGGTLQGALTDLLTKARLE